MFQGTKSACNIQHIPLEANIHTEYDNVATPALSSECEALTLQSLSPHPGMETVGLRQGWFALTPRRVTLDCGDMEKLEMRIIYCSKLALCPLDDCQGVRIHHFVCISVN